MSIFDWIKALQGDAEYVAAVDEWGAADEKDDEAGRAIALAKMEARAQALSGKPAPKGNQ